MYDDPPTIASKDEQTQSKSYNDEPSQIELLLLRCGVLLSPHFAHPMSITLKHHTKQTLETGVRMDFVPEKFFPDSATANPHIPLGTIEKKALVYNFLFIEPKYVRVIVGKGQTKDRNQ